ncbi:MAG: PDZ domain-containing protein, partial [Chloroflexi bacterium]|nr:PDZ domain-containing protein [Chloroflexota bacterium]
AVFPGSPADAGGILPGDLLVSVDGRQLATIADLDALMRSGAPPIGPIEVAVIRDGAELTLEIDLAAGGMFGGGLPAQ